MMQTTPQTVGANLAAGASVGAAGVTWVAKLNAYLQLGATAVAFLAGCFAIWWHVEKIIQSRKRRANSTPLPWRKK